MMATYDELIGTLQYLLSQKFAPKPQYVRGLLGDGQGNVEVPGRPDRNYVRFNRSTTEFFEVFNRTVNPVDNWPVLIGELPWQPGLTQVVDTDWSAFEQSGWGDSMGSTSPHAPTHQWPDGAPGSDPVNVYLRAIVPLRGYTLGSGTSTVYVNAYEYEYNATGTVWGGLPGVDMSPIMAATATGTMRYAGVYLDPLTNTLGVVTGTTTVHTDAFDPPYVDFPGNTMPSARVRIYGGQNGVLEADLRDARRPWAAAGAEGGRTNRIVSGDSPYSVVSTDAVLFCDTDGGAITANLPAGVEGAHHKIINVGSSANDVTVDPNGAEQLFGAGAGVAFTLMDGEVIDIHYNSVEGWW